MLFLVIILLGLSIIVWVIYNRLVALKNNREQAFADIDVQLKQRFDLIPNLVETVKWYAKHEKELFENVTKARTSFMNAQTVEDKMQANNMLTSTLKSLFAVAENYPNLKANENFMQLQMELSDIENKIAAARRFFNATTKEYNTYVESFPVNIIASIFWFQKAQMFEIENREEVEKRPEIKF